MKCEVTELGGSPRGQCLGQTRVRPPPCILLHNTECTVHPTAQPLLHRAVLHAGSLIRSLSCYCCPSDLSCELWGSDFTVWIWNCVWSMNGCIYNRTYWYISIFDFPKLKLDTTTGWERIMRHDFFSKCLYFLCKRNTGMIFLFKNSYGYFYREALLAIC